VEPQGITLKQAMTTLVQLNLESGLALPQGITLKQAMTTAGFLQLDRLGSCRRASR